MARKGGGPVAEILGTGLGMGTSYYAYKNSDSYGGFLWLRFKYGTMLLAFFIALFGIPVLLFYLFAKKSPLNNTTPAQKSTVPVQPSA